MSKAKTKTCNRCSGTGTYMTDRVCFGCNGAGVVIADPFIRVIGERGDFFGLTAPSPVKGTLIKAIVRGARAAIEADIEAGTTMKAITEEQARRFYKAHGISTQVAA